MLRGPRPTVYSQRRKQGSGRVILEAERVLKTKLRAAKRGLSSLSPSRTPEVLQLLDISPLSYARCERSSKERKYGETRMTITIDWPGKVDSPRRDLCGQQPSLIMPGTGICD